MIIEYTDLITKDLLDEFDKWLVEQYDIEPNEIFTAGTEWVERTQNGGEIWPSILKLGGTSASSIIEIINMISLRDYEEALIGTERECNIGESECYEDWLESNLPFYEEVDDYDDDTYNHEEAIDSARSLARMVTVDDID
jgi:hypothetical protein